jgi:hypothetical protein
MIRLLSTLLAVAGLATGAAAGARGAGGSDAKVLVVLGGQAAQSPALVERAGRLAERAHVQLRVAPTATTELGVTHLFAARRYAEVIAVGLDARVSVAPVQARYPHTRFVPVAADAGAIERALATVSG